MALDLRHLVERFDQTHLVERASLLSFGEHATLEVDGDYLTLFKPLKTPKNRRIEVNTVYGLLERLGVICIQGEAHDGKIELSGGSICRIHLDMGTEPKVTKQVTTTDVDSLDGRIRHQLEAHWLPTKAEEFENLFPSILHTPTKSNALYSMRFFPAYTLGEHFIHGRLDSNGGKQLIHRCFDLLARTVYRQQVDGDYENYHGKVFRRNRQLLEDPKLPPEMADLIEYGGMVNGTRCRPVSMLLEIVDSKREFSTILANPDPRMSHGDLIPEDILYSFSEDSICFVDPNPQISDPLADVGKMLMSFQSNYDLALRNRIKLEIEGVGNHISITTITDPIYNRYTELQEELGVWLLNSLPNLPLKDCISKDRLTPQAVRLFAGLQMIALPIFHLLHHNNKGRAMFFLAKGLQLLEDSVREIECTTIHYAR